MMFYSIGLLLFALHADADPPPRIDQIKFFIALSNERPDLIRNDCKNNLIVKSQYRNRVLAGRLDFETLMRSHYSGAQRAADLAWADKFRVAAIKLRNETSLPFYVADYPIDKFVGYHVGHKTNYDAEGLGRKIYLEFASATETLSPNVYLKFTLALLRAGFNGDSKVQLAPGVARFQFNNIVIHAGSSTDAKIAERVATKFFKEKLVSIGRGLDIKINQRTFDWNNFLCAKVRVTLPPSANSYLSYAE
jgi:hypothetical protein